MATQIGSLMVRLGMDSADFATGSTNIQKSIGRLRDSFESLGKKWNDVGKAITRQFTAPVVGAFGAFGVAARSVANDLEGIRNSANLAGESFENFQRQSYAARSIGIEFEKLGDIFKDTRDKVGDFIATGGGEMADFFENIAPKVGVTRDMFRGLGGRDALQLYYNSLRAANVSSSEMVFYLEAIADEASGLIPLLENNGRLFDQLGANAPVVSEESAASFDRYRDALKKFGEALQRIVVAIADSGVLDLLTSVIERAAGLADAFAKINPWVFRIAAGFALAAAAIGPMMLVMGTLAAVILPLFAARFGVIGIAISAFINPLGTAISFLVQFASEAAKLTVLRTIGAAIASVGTKLLRFAGPVGLIASAGILIYQNWERIAPLFQAFWQQVQQSLGPPLQDLVSTIRGMFTELWRGPLGDMLRGAMKLLGQFGGAASNILGDAVVHVLRGLLEVATDVFRAIGHWLEGVNALLNNDFRGAWEAAGRMLADITSGMLSAVEIFVPGVVGLMRNLFVGVREWLQNGLGRVFDWVREKIAAVEQSFAWLYDRVVGNSHVPDMVDEIAAQMGRLDSVMVQTAANATSATEQSFRELARNVRDIMDRLFPEAAQLREYRDELAALEAGAAAGLISQAQLDEARARARRDLADVPLDGSTGRPAIADYQVPQFDVASVNDIASATSGALDMLAGKASQFRDIAARAFDSFTYQLEGFLLGAQSALDAVRNLVKELASAAFRQFIVQPLGAALGLQIPGFASGTMSAPRGLALVGEGGPELVNFRGGERVYTNSQSNRMAASGFGGGITVNMNASMSEREGRQTAGAAARELQRKMIALRTGLAG
ncbi:hypothetical protein [Aurantiacibacter hainanensis]|uniref:hypothetical protein n=1 Tax=Aurantiacibacter hainanensis TaxID=3076114 RepID=UPI0030C6C949